MNLLETFHLQHPEWLWAIPLALWLPWWLRRQYRQNAAWSRYCEPRLLARLSHVRGRGSDSRGLACLLSALLLLATLSAAGPSWRQESYPMLESSAARVIVLELSQRMLVEDLQPNRFERARDLARQLLATDFDGETGLVAFAGAAFVVSPLSRDAGTLNAFLEALHPETMPLDGSRIDLGIASAQDLLEASVAGRGHILVIGSGDEEIDPAVAAAQLAAGRGHRVSVLAVGSAEGGPLRDRRGALQRDEQGGFVVARTRFAELQRIARVGGGGFFRLEDALTQSASLELDAASRELDALAELRQEDERKMANDGALVVWFMLPLALLLFRRNALWILLLAIYLPAERPLMAQDYDAWWQHVETRALQAYRQGDYIAAIELSRQPLLLGAAHYRRGEYERALEAFARDDSAQGWYNRGNSHARLEQFPEALSAYLAALEREPGHRAAAYNRDLVAAYLERQRERAREADPDADSADDPETGDIENGEQRVGLAARTSPNPGEQDDSGAGEGASRSGGQFSGDDSYTGRERDLDALLLQENSAEVMEQAQIEDWINSLPETSTELFRRKFLRDYERQRQQAR